MNFKNRTSINSITTLFILKNLLLRLHFFKNDIVIYRIDIWQWKCSIHWKHKFWSVADCKITCSWTITWFTLKPQIMPRTHTLQNVVRQDFLDMEWKFNRNWNKRSNPDKPLILIQISAQCTSWKRKVM